MGMQDRDYYREDYAKKNGMVYDSRNATYAAARRFFLKRRSPPRPPTRSAPVPEMSPFHALIWTVVICATIFLVLLLIYKVTK